MGFDFYLEQILHAGPNLIRRTRCAEQTPIYPKTTGYVVRDAGPRSKHCQLAKRVGI